jgi:CheY-like chemotaxis protein
VSVTDNGSGISAGDLARVFEPFFSKKRVKDQSGSGLGLAIVHGVVKEHNGFVDVQSRAGCTAFTLYFPLTKASPVAMEQKVTPVPGMARILIVDDEPVQLRTGRRVLRHLGYEVDTLVSGKQACDVFKQAAACGKNPYDLVILDMILNEHEDGLQVLERIHQLFPELPAILASGHAPTERAELAVTKGLTWLIKPYTMDVLARTVSNVLPCTASSAGVQHAAQP